ncbi:MAG: Fur family transcriptional regulator [Alphaproteobacteria bacterium]
MAEGQRPARRRALTNNHKTVLGALRDAGRPLTAYDLIARLKDQGISSPPTVYRALSRLTDDGLAHRLESLNAFVACQSGGGHDEAAIFTICNDCGQADEITDTVTADGLTRHAEENGFTVTSVTCELRGRCAQCQAT